MSFAGRNDMDVMKTSTPTHLDTAPLQAAWRAAQDYLIDPETDTIRRGLVNDPRKTCLYIAVAAKGMSLALGDVEDVAGQLDRMAPGPGDEIRQYAGKGHLVLIFHDQTRGAIKLVHSHVTPALVQRASSEARA